MILTDNNLKNKIIITDIKKKEQRQLRWLVEEKIVEPFAAKQNILKWKTAE